MNQLTISVAQATELTGLGKTKIYQLIRDNQLVVSRVGRRTLVSVESIELLIANNIVPRRPR